MYNNPSGTIGQVTLGPGVIYLGSSGSTPSVDVGYVRGSATLNFKREQVEIRQGSPQTIVDALASAEDVMIEFTGIEWDMDNLLHVLGDGATSVSGAQEILKMGGTPANAKKALRYVHRMSDGGTLEVDIWKCIGEGTFEASINPDDLHEIKYKFKAIDPGSTDWAGASLTDGQKLVKVIRTRP